jgi:hypothetical protein
LCIERATLSAKLDAPNAERGEAQRAEAAQDRAASARALPSLTLQWAP